MLAVPVFDVTGKRTGEMEIDPAVLGGHVRAKLLKQAVVAFLDHQRQRSARNKSRSDVQGSTRKLYRQKGTGNARAGSARTPIRRGGGRAFAKRGPTAVKDFSKKMRRLARNNAILSKIQSQEAVIVDGVSCDPPKTSAFAAMLAALGVDRGCLFATHELDRNVYLSGRNIPDTDIRVVGELSAYEVLRRPKVIFTKSAFERIQQDPLRFAASSSEAQG